MLFNPLLALASATLALASPCALSTPTLPYNSGGTQLPSPPNNVTLKHITLGLGIQNYSCSTGSPVSTGALAMLYDITRFYPKRPTRQALSTDDWAELTATALDSCDVPLNLLPSGGADSSNPFTESDPLEVSGHSFPVLGHHYFDAAGTPTFDLGSQVLSAKKIDSVPAPSDANAGPDGTGAVAWLYLGDNGKSIGLSYVYRVYTAGGNSHGCSSAEDSTDSTSYSAQYWFYG
ncbi:hypothetical protein BGZ63DRAFT_398819 [Mariannaea sp. PMI_226]|nr:hypothetical protein BGZ63DRAFT_398819 [Mariannaea sp. PMI_226]